MLKKIFSNRKETKIGDLQILFYVDAAAHGSHGRIRVTHRKRGLTERVVHWVAVGVTTAPDLTPSLMEHIWREAYAQGYVPHALVGCLEDNVPMDVPAQGVVAESDVPAVWRSGRSERSMEPEMGHRTQGFEQAARLHAQASSALN